MGDHTKVSAPVIDLDQTEHIYDNRYNIILKSLNTNRSGLTKPGLSIIEKHYQKKIPKSKKNRLPTEISLTGWCLRIYARPNERNLAAVITVFFANCREVNREARGFYLPEPI